VYDSTSSSAASNRGWSHNSRALTLRWFNFARHDVVPSRYPAVTTVAISTSLDFMPLTLRGQQVTNQEIVA
jgi:hypothetical protein